MIVQNYSIYSNQNKCHFTSFDTREKRKRMISNLANNDSI
jgi:hypothetical protein